MEALVDDREDHRLGEADDEQRHRHAEDDLAECDRRRDVPHAREELGAQAVLVPLGGSLHDLQRRQRRGRAEKRGRVHDRHRSAAGNREEPRADERRDQPQPLAHRREGAVRVGQQVVGEHRLQQSRAAGGEDPGRPAVDERDEVDQPDLTAVVDEQEQQHDAGHRRVHEHQQRAAAHAVDDEPGERGDEPPQGQDEEDQACRRVRARERLRPDREREPHRRVAEHRQRLAGQQQAHVAP